MATSPLTRLRRVCLALPEAHEVLAWGEPTFRIRNRMFATFASATNHHGRGRHAVWVKALPINQDLLVRSAPQRVFVPPYVGPSGWIGLYLDDVADWDEVSRLLRDGYILVAPKRLAAQVATATADVAPLPGPEDRLARFIAQYDPAVAALGTGAIDALRTRLPGARLLVYDNYNALAVGFGPTDSTPEAVLSIAFFPRWVSLFFLWGATLPDPGKRLKGSGRQVRHLVLNGVRDLEDPYVVTLIEQAVRSATTPFPKKGGCVVIKSVSARRRPRRPPAKRRRR